jgi:hypothetical protein
MSSEVASADSSLGDFELKRRRARRHSEELQRSIKAFESAARESVRGEFDADEGRYHFDIPVGAIDPMWTMALGDFAYDMRASLNYLVTALVRSTGQVESERNEFPIFGMDRTRLRETASWWREDQSGAIGRRLENTPHGTKELLERLQPFYGVPATDPLRHPLAALHLLTNRDKHRRLNVLVRQARIQFVDRAGEQMYEGPPAHVGRINKPAESEQYTASLSVAQPFDRDIYLRAEYGVRINEPPELFGEVATTVIEIDEFIGMTVVPVVRHLLAASG